MAEGLLHLPQASPEEPHFRVDVLSLTIEKSLLGGGGGSRL